MLGALAGILVLWALLGFLVVPRILRPVIERKLAAALHRPVTLRSLAINPFTLGATLEGLEVKEPGGAGTFFSFRRLRADVEAISLVERGPVIRAITLEGPSLTLVRKEDGTYNAQDLLEEALRPSPKDEKPLHFSLNNIRVEDGTVDFDDRPRGTRHTVRGLRIGIPFLSNVASKVEISTLPLLEARVNGAAFALHGRTKPFSETRETTVDLDLKDVDLPHYLAYLPSTGPRLGSGRLDAALTIAFSEARKGPPSVTVSGTTALRNVAIASADRPLAAWERLDAVIRSVDVFGRRALLARLTLEKPQLWYRRGPDAGASRRAPEAARPGPAKPFVVDVAETSVDGGTLHFEDATAAAPFRAELGAVAFRMRNFSTAPGKTASLELSATSDAREMLRGSGTLAWEPLLFEGEVAVADVPLKRYAPYLDRVFTFAVDDGVLRLASKFRVAVGGEEGAAIALSGLTAELASPRLRKRGEKEPFLSAPALTLSASSIDFARREAALGTLASARGTLAVVREKDGSADLAKLVVESPPGEAPPPAPSRPWTLALERLSLEEYTVNVDDRAQDRPARYALTRLNLGLDRLSAAEGARSTLAARFGVDGTGVATARGPVGFRPVFADLDVRVQGIDLVPLEAYVLAGFRLSLAKGSVSGAGKLGFSEGPGGEARVTFAGDARVADFFTVERATKTDFLKWDALAGSGLRAGLNPTYFEASRIALDGVWVDLVVDADGTMNARRVLGRAPVASAPAPEAAPASTPAAAAPAAAPPPGANILPLRIDTLALENGRIAFADRSIPGGYAATLEGIAGKVTGLSSRDGTVAQLDLKASLGKSAPVELKGALNLLAAASFADVTASVKGVDLPPFTPYAGKYMGYGIGRGALAMELAYKLKDRKLAAQNRFLVDQLELGEKVESKDATKLPVKLAISLLKDRRGLIDLDVPVEGSLDDPKFRLGRVILKVIVNLIGKAATAPFSLLGKLFSGGGPEMSSVSFADGSAVLDDSARAKLDALAKALDDRPALKLQAAGRLSEKDAEGLRRALFERKLKAAKLADLVKKREAPASVDDVTVGKDEYAAYLEKAYRREKMKKPRNLLGVAKSLPPDEMEKRMLANVAVADADLRQLAFARANAVKDYLTGPGKVDAARVLVLDPGSKGADSKAPSGARVDFALE